MHVVKEHRARFVELGRMDLHGVSKQAVRRLECPYLVDSHLDSQACDQPVREKRDSYADHHLQVLTQQGYLLLQLAHMAA